MKMKYNVHPGIFLGASTVSVVGAVLGFVVLYPVTHSQPDFGYALGVVALLVVVCATSLTGIAWGVAGIVITRRWILLLACAAGLNILVGAGTFISFQSVYEKNQPLIETIEKKLTSEPRRNMEHDAQPAHAAVLLRMKLRRIADARNVSAANRRWSPWAIQDS